MEYLVYQRPYRRDLSASALEREGGRQRERKKGRGRRLKQVARGGEEKQGARAERWGRGAAASDEARDNHGAQEDACMLLDKSGLVLVNEPC